MILMLYFFSRKFLKIRVVFQVDEVLVTISLKINCELVLRIDFWIRENPERLSILPSSSLIDLWWLSQMMKKVYPDRTKPKIKCLVQFFLNKSHLLHFDWGNSNSDHKRLWERKDFSMKSLWTRSLSDLTPVPAELHIAYAAARWRVVYLKTINVQFAYWDL